MSGSKQRIADLVETLQATLRKIHDLESGGGSRGGGLDNGPLLHAPAAEQQILDFERRLGRTFPPLYREFLRLHNGWERSWGDMTFIGVSGAHTQSVLKKVEEYVQFQRDEELAGVLNSFSDSEIAAWESRDPRNLYLPNHLGFATNFAGELWVFDSRTRRPNGEMSIVYWTLDYGAWEERRHEDFGRFLAWASSEADATLERLLDEEKKRAARRKPGQRDAKKERKAGSGKPSRGKAVATKRKTKRH